MPSFKKCPTSAMCTPTSICPPLSSACAHGCHACRYQYIYAVSTYVYLDILWTYQSLSYLHSVWNYILYYRVYCSKNSEHILYDVLLSNECSTAPSVLHMDGIIQVLRSRRVDGEDALAAKVHAMLHLSVEVQPRFRHDFVDLWHMHTGCALFRELETLEKSSRAIGVHMLEACLVA